MTTLSQDLELARKHGVIEQEQCAVNPTLYRDIYCFNESNLAAFLAERDAVLDKVLGEPIYLCGRPDGVYCELDASEYDPRTDLLLYAPKGLT